MRHVLLATLAAILLAGPAAAQETPPPQGPATEVSGVNVDGETPPVPQTDPVICRRVESTGSRISTQKVCKPKSEWVAQSRRRSGGGDVNQSDCGGPSGCEIYALPST
ncbi:MAG: hypothetical protein Q7V15_03450 [Phenylobacterium sp.]|uniref:hypothetical protein n=1 Tax=Phenylobacterium sp. TaxID=1871053 RepID=UPI00271DAE8A|nr:hypothetical protein [Phenylobacterium sp.]MDO8900389.1 hypothetical protein [Phenylobacterium sp.]MDP2213366.1 hypothetical protein [Phenylobacterium sp.]